MATSILRICLLLTALWVTDGQRTTAEDSHCSYTFKVPATECGPNPVDDQFMKSSMIALQTQMKLLAAKHTEDIRKLTEENDKLREKIEAGKTDISTYNIRRLILLIVVMNLYVSNNTHKFVLDLLQ